MCRVASFIADLRQRGSAKPLGYGVIGSTSDSGSFSLGSSPSTPADWFSRVFDEPTSGPHRLAAQDTALSRRRHGFKSRWGYKSDSLSCHRSRLFGSWQDFCSEGARVRIIQVSDCFLPRMGGIETQVSRLSQELADRGHDVTVLTATFDSPLKGFEKPWESSDERNAWVQGAECSATGATTAKTASPGEEGASYRVVRSGWLNPFGLPVDPRAAKRFAEYIRAQQPDVVNFHMGELTPVVMDTIRELRGEKIPTIVAIHSVWSNGPTVFGYRAGARLLGLAEEPILWAPVSELVATNVREVVGSDQIRIMGNGINQAQWRVQPTPHSGLRAVAATRFAPRKRVPDLLRTLRKVGDQLGINGQGSQNVLEVVLAGEGPGLSFAKRYVRDHGMEGWVKLPGRLKQEELVELYGTSDAFLAPGVKDSFSIAGREALVAGLAVLTRSQSGLGADLLDGVEGRSVDTDDQMAEVLVDWVRDPEMVAPMKKHNLETDYRYSWDQVIPQTVSLYEEAIQRAKR